MEQEIWKDIKGLEGKRQISNWGRIKTFNWNNTGKTKVSYGSFNKDNGYMILPFKCETSLVHRLVALYFIPIPEHLKNIPIEDLDVGHLKTMPNGKEDTTANEVWNLAWMSKSENQTYGTLSQRRKQRLEGKSLSQEQKKHISESLKGRVFTDEWKKRISESKKGTKLSKEAREHMSEARKGKYNTKKSKSVLQIDNETNEIIAEFPSSMEIERQLGFNHRNISACCCGKRKSAYGYKWQNKIID